MRSPDSRRSSGRLGLLIALVLVALVLITVYFREGESGPVRSARTGVQAAAAPIASAGEYLTRPVRAFSEWRSGLGVSREEIEALREQNRELRRRVAELEEARQENERLRALVDFVQVSEIEALGARVIGRPSNAWEDVITIDRGTADGVAPGMPVIGDGGLIGQTVDVTERSSRVRLITDQRSGVAAMLQASRAEGIVRGAIDRTLSLDFVSRETTVQVGEIVLTSGMGGVYPRGLTLGEVIEVTLDDNSLYPAIVVRPSARIATIEEVLVLTGSAPEVPVGGGE